MHDPTDGKFQRLSRLRLDSRVDHYTQKMFTRAAPAMRRAAVLATGTFVAVKSGKYCTQFDIHGAL